jgi:hypothetical protein
MANKKAEFNTDWFKLERYKGLETLDAKGWYAQIQARRSLNHQIESNRELDGSFFIVGDESHFGLAWQQQIKQSILEDGKAKIHTNNLSWERLNYVYKKLGLEHLDGMQTSKEITRRRTGGEYDGISGCEVQAALVVKDIERLKKNPIVTANNSWLDEELKGLPNQYDGAAVCSYDDETYPIMTTSWDEIQLVAINTTATIEQIKKDFDAWLEGHINANPLPTSQARRKGRANEKLLDEADFYQWRKYKVIPYLDLTLIAKAEGKKIQKYSRPGQCMVKLIDYSARTIGKEVETRAKSLLTDKTFHQLYLQLLNR